MTPLAASYTLWVLWLASWVAAAVWTRRTEARPPLLSQLADRIPTGVGGVLLFYGSSEPLGWQFRIPIQLWTLPFWASWLMTAAGAAGFGFAWWARLTLGDLWSGTVSLKENHEIIDRGPYSLVRHPIYTGIIFAAFALAIQIGMASSLLGAAFMTLGFWMKARLEERFLADEIGEGAYADYRRHTPMLVPFWPKGA